MSLTNWPRRTIPAGILLLVVAIFSGAITVPSAAADKPAGTGTATSKAERAVPKKSKPTTRIAKRQPAEEEGDASGHPFPRRQKAPSLDGGVAWINTAGPIDLKQLRGKFVVLDFWTYCCINCMHILPNLKKLEHAYPNEIVVIGVHSAKFDGEQDTKNILDAVLRHEIEHPVVNDAKHRIWQRFDVQSWPTLCVIDPEGNLVVHNSGEVDFDSLDAFFKKVIPYYRKHKLLDTTPLRFELAANAQKPTPLRYPGKLLADEAGDRLFISDSNHNRIVVTHLDGTLIDVIGSGDIGSADGNFEKATFDHPQGMALGGDTLYVADTENHLLRAVDLKKKYVTTIAGTGRQGHGWPGVKELADGTTKVKRRFTGPALKTALNSPWALWLKGNDLYVAMAGNHQIWKMALPKGEIGVFAGNGREDIVDGPLVPSQPYEQGFSSFAQPSGLSSDGKMLFVADSEGSSIRAVPFDASGQAITVVGTSGLPFGRLFAFGDVDGQGQDIRLQHALDVLYHDKLLYVADTYNNKIKVVDPSKTTSETLVGTGAPGLEDSPAQFDEPAGLAYAKKLIYVADTNNHVIRTIDLAHGNKVATLEIKGLKAPTPPPVDTKPSFPGAEEVTLPAAKAKTVDGKLHLQVAIDLPEGFKLNKLAPVSYLIEAQSPAGPVAREAIGKLANVKDAEPTFDIELPTTAAAGNETLKVSLAYYYCQDGSEGVCKAGSVIWTLPVTLAADARDTSITLPLKVE